MSNPKLIITISSSSKFYEAAKKVYSQLVAGGATVYTPSFVHNETTVVVDADTKAKLTHRFLNNLKRSQVMYVVNSGGYVGLSVAIEVGFATALSIPVVFSEEPTEDAFKALSAGILSLSDVSLEKLAPFVNA